MFLDFFLLLKNDGLPVSMKEYLTLLEALHKEVAGYKVDDFYFLARTILVKHEKYLDRFDMLFGHHFKNMELIPKETFLTLPKEWLERKNFEELSEEEKALIEAMGGLDALRKRFEELLNEQKERHEGGDKWIGTAGKSPFGAYGYNPEGFRIGQQGNRMRRAVKVWDKREFRNLSDSVELDTRNLKMTLRRLRILTREGRPTELDIDTTIDHTCRNAGILDIELVPVKKNRVKVLLLFDIGGSMDEYIALVERLFSAAKYEFKNMEYFYFHNCLYESVWKDNRRRFEERIPTFELLHKYNSDYKVIVVGDAYMSPYEVAYAGGSVEHYNKEAGSVWLDRLKKQFPYIIWLNPTAERYWKYADSIAIIREIFDDRMFPLTIEGITLAMKALKDKKIDYEPKG